MKKILFIFGTRPEIIKFTPLINYFNLKNNFIIEILNTNQQKDIINLYLENIKPKITYNLNIENNSLNQFLGDCIKKINCIINASAPNYIFVLGDTTTALAGAIASSNQKVKLVHIEAGYRSYNRYHPFPEENNRILISQLANYHFTPTKYEKKNLKKENIKKNVFIVGNTGIDNLFNTLSNIDYKYEEKIRKKYYNISFDKKYILTTIHRRENCSNQLEKIMNFFERIVADCSDLKIIIPLHTNPVIRKKMIDRFSYNKKIILIETLSYKEMLFFILNSYFVISDSGGLQEEIPYLNKHLFVIRNYTERKMSLKLKSITLINNKMLDNKINELIKFKKIIKKMYPYGYGNSSEKIYKIINEAK